jgi:hypothetical protein
MEFDPHLQMSVSPSSKDLVMASYVVLSSLFCLGYRLMPCLIDAKA